jgi:hypothetical protein
LIFIAIKKILENQPKGKWAEELPRAVWNHNTSVCRVMKFTPFKLLYREEVVTLEEIKLHSARTKTEATYSPSEAESKDLLELESQTKEYRSWRFSIVAKPEHRSFRKVET